MKQFRNTLYWVTEDGKILNSKTNRYLKFCLKQFSKNKSKRMYGILYIGGVKKGIFLHRLIAEAFIPNPLNLPQVNHIDGNPLNNCVTNLEWCSAGDNNKHAIKTGLRSNKLFGKTEEIKTKYKNGEKYTSLANQYKVSYTSIWNIINNKTWIT